MKGWIMIDIYNNQPSSVSTMEGFWNGSGVGKSGPPSCDINSGKNATGLVKKVENELFRLEL